jgi:membrane-bound serine protease (ClpP class)
MEDALGYILIAAAVTLFLVEALAPTGGLIGLMGIAALVAGLIILEVPIPAIVVLVVAIVAVSALFGAKVWRAMRQERVLTGWEELIGDTGEVRVALVPDGQIFIGGALWRARVAEGAEQVPVGARVRVREVDGLTLLVEPLG